MTGLKLVKNSPVNLETIKSLFEENDIRLAISPNAVLPFSDKNWQKTFILNEKAVIRSYFLKQQGAVIGHVGFSEGKVLNTLGLVYVIIRKDKRGQGLINSLLELAIDRARQLYGNQEIYLKVNQDNFAAQRAYERAGFVESERSNGTIKMSRQL